MSFTMLSIRQILAVSLTGVALVASGCADSATRDDVSDARENLREEQSDLAEAQQEAQDVPGMLAQPAWPVCLLAAALLKPAGFSATGGFFFLRRAANKNPGL
jgi:hypothetical protein